MADIFEHIPEEMKTDALKSSEQKTTPKAKKTDAGGEKTTTVTETRQRRIFKRTRANVVLTREEVKAIKAGRKKLRKEMRERGLKRKEDFELTAGSLGLYFDKPNHGFLLWLKEHWLASLIGALLMLLAVLFLFSLVQRMRGHFTVNLSDGMLENGYALYDNIQLENPTMQLFATPTENAPCVSISQIAADVNGSDGKYESEDFFAYKFYLRNEGTKPSNFKWELNINSEYKNLSEAAWVILFIDGDMSIYAKEGADGEAEALPEISDTRHGYLNIPLMECKPDSDQFQIVATNHHINYYRVVPYSFLSEKSVIGGVMTKVQPEEVHEFTVLIYLEGDDPECTDELIGGSLGVEMRFQEENEEIDEDANQTDAGGIFGFLQPTLKSIFSGLKD